MRKPWDEYFLDIAAAVAERATCPRRHVGAVLVKDRRILATGYNGSLPGDPHCEDSGCDVVDNHCQRTVHAEINALLQAARFGIAIEGASLYCTLEPCVNCTKALITAGVTEIRFRDLYAGGAA